MRMNRLVRGLSALLLVTALGVSATPASATAAWLCPKGSVCFYFDGAGTRFACALPSNGRPSCADKYIWGIYNNGYYQPGADHAYVYGHYVGTTTYTKGCIHQGHKGALPRSIMFNWVIWSGECGQFDENWTV